MKRCMVVVALVALAIGSTLGWLIGTLRGKHNCTFFLHGMAASEIYSQERAASEAYLTQPPETARWALTTLLHTYARYRYAPEPNPGERASNLRFASAMAHARLADVSAKLNQEDQRTLHLEQALQLSGLADEESLQGAVDALNKAEQNALRQPTP
jgi:hypothetical protein